MLSKRLFLSSVVLLVLASFLFVGSVGASSEMWSQTYESGRFQSAYSLVETSDGGYALVGFMWLMMSGDIFIWAVKTDEYGIIPEFPSWTILPLLLAATLTAIIYRKKLYRTQTQQSY
jgi:hypothetical protein